VSHESLHEGFHREGMQRARVSLDGLSVGDAFGERFFQSMAVLPFLLERRWIPEAPWKWTDDTAMAISIVEVLEAQRGIDADLLAALFGRRYAAEPERGYGGGAHQILSLLARGAPWREAAVAPFENGSFGNGGAMRAAPIGAYFSGDPAKAAAHAKLSAMPTHLHPEGIAGAISIAVAASLIHQFRGLDLIRETAAHTPASATRDGLEESLKLDVSLTSRDAAAHLGNGSRVAAFDTVPFAVYAAAHHGGDFEDALRFTVAGLGDRDTTCAIVGGIIANTTTIPKAMLDAREPLPAH
jgi:ADP-ribosylglycohydrolase